VRRVGERRNEAERRERGRERRDGFCSEACLPFFFCSLPRRLSLFFFFLVIRDNVWSIKARKKEERETRSICRFILLFKFHSFVFFFGGGSLAAFSVFLSLSLILFLYNIK
jgi:hypothetical protein